MEYVSYGFGEVKIVFCSLLLFRTFRGFFYTWYNDKRFSIFFFSLIPLCVIQNNQKKKKSEEKTVFPIVLEQKLPKTRLYLITIITCWPI